MYYESISFNEDWIKSQTEEEFLANPLNASHWTQPGFTVSEKVRQDRLRELYRLIVPRQSPHDWLFKKEREEAMIMNNYSNSLDVLTHSLIEAKEKRAFLNPKSPDFKGKDFKLAAEIKLLTKLIKNAQSEQYAASCESGEPGDNSSKVDGTEYGDISDPAKGTNELRSELQGRDDWEVSEPSLRAEEKSDEP